MKAVDIEKLRNRFPKQNQYNYIWGVGPCVNCNEKTKLHWGGIVYICNECSEKLKNRHGYLHGGKIDKMWIEDFLNLNKGNVGFPRWYSKGQ